MNVPVVVVGGGPTGLTAATLLGQYGVECTVLERHPTIYPLPRAVALDEEIYRILARLGVAREFAAVAWPCEGLRLVTRDKRVLAELRRETANGRHGYPAESMFDQPALEAILRRNLERYRSVTFRGGVEVTALAQDDTGVRVDLVERASGTQESVRAANVLGCDGANSMTRRSIGATMQDLSFTQRWLVVDVQTEADLREWNGVHQVCDRARAATYMRTGRTRYRWEFLLAPGESADAYRDIHRLHPWIAPWTKDVPIDELTIVRAAEYTFRAQVANRWRDRRTFLLGDAAHLTPPFIGQGMGAGLRDGMNLAWKLAGVLGGTLPARVLDTYEIERKHHASAMIRWAKLVGIAMTSGGTFGGVLRRAIAPRLHLVPGIEKQVLIGETPPLHRSALVMRPRLRRSLAGRQCPNGRLDGSGHRLDDVAAGRFAIVTCEGPSVEQRAEVERRGALVIPAGPGSELHRWLTHGRARAALVRPDGAVLFASRDVSKVCAAMCRLDTDIRSLPRLSPVTA